MLVVAIAVLILAFALVPAALYWANVFLYRPAPGPGGSRPAVSILIPARNEERAIGSAVEAALRSLNAEIEVVVLDDQSTDRTAEIVESIRWRDARVRLERSQPLPEGWCGKQFACLQLARLARYDLLLFVDSDVRLSPDGCARLAAFLDQSGADLVSGVPRQETGTLAERLVIPLIHFLLLGFLPLRAMRRSSNPAFAAGCGQLFLARRRAYEAMGGHEAVKASLHDGLTLPRAFRRAGFRTDLCDATDLATCRMYRSGRELWRGLVKNAREGLAAPGALVPSTAVLLGGQVLPWAWIAVEPWSGLIAGLTGLSMRVHGVVRFQQSRLGAILHPLGVAMLVLIQWDAAVRSWLGRPAGWKGRAHPAGAAAS